MTEASTELSQSIVFFHHGARKRLGEFWADKPCLLVFLRHLACPSCFEQIQDLLRYLSALEKNGVRVVLVTSAAPSRIPAFAVRAHLDNRGVDVVTDPTLAAHKSAGLHRSVWKTLGPQAVIASLRLYLKSGFISREDGDGDVFQQGGVMLIDTSGSILFHHMNDNAGEITQLGAVCELPLAHAQ